MVDEQNQRQPIDGRLSKGASKRKSSTGKDRGRQRILTIDLNQIESADDSD